MIPVQFVWSQDILKGIQIFLEGKVNKWDQNLQGIVKSYENIRILSHKSRILEDVGVLSVAAKFTVNYFAPKIGQQLVAVVKNWNDKEIGGLVEVFNTVVNNAQGSFENEAWKDVNGADIKKGSKIKFLLEK